MTHRTSAAALACAAVGLLVAPLSACESAQQKAADHALKKAADVGTCRADATPIPKPYAKGFPQQWPFPPRTTVYGSEDRGDSGTIITATSSAPFKMVLSFMNNQVVKAGFKVKSGETETHDAEAEWEGNAYRGRWAIRESAQCPGETVIQVVAAPAS